MSKLLGSHRKHIYTVQEGGSDRILNNSITDMNELIVAFIQLLKAVKFSLVHVLPTSNEKFFFLMEGVKMHIRPTYVQERLDN